MSPSSPAVDGHRRRFRRPRHEVAVPLAETVPDRTIGSVGLDVGPHVGVQTAPGDGHLYKGAQLVEQPTAGTMKPTTFVDHPVEVDPDETATADWEKPDRQPIDDWTADRLAGLRVPHRHRSTVQTNQRPPRVVKGAQNGRRHRAPRFQRADDVGLITFAGTPPRSSTVETHSDFRRVSQRPLPKIADIGDRREERMRHTVEFCRSCRPDRTYDAPSCTRGFGIFHLDQFPPDPPHPPMSAGLFVALLVCLRPAHRPPRRVFAPPLVRHLEDRTGHDPAVVASDGPAR